LWITASSRREPQVDPTSTGRAARRRLRVVPDDDGKLDMSLPQPTNCKANDDMQEVTFDLAFEGKTWKAAISYGKIDKLYGGIAALTPSSNLAKTRESAVCKSAEVTRLVVARIRAGATEEPVVIS
jgi:hypothetical protein